jgi:hypothetical protein
MNLSQFGGFSGFLDEFVLHTFLPQLEEKVIQMFEHSVNGKWFFFFESERRVMNTYSAPSQHPMLFKTIRPNNMKPARMTRCLTGRN